MFVDKLQFTPAELEAKETDFRKVMAKIPLAEQVMDELDVFFLNKNDAEIQAVRWTYWRWFTDLTWEFLNGLRPGKVAGVLATQTPMALAIGRDVWKQTVNYLACNGYHELEMPIIFGDIKDAFLNSDMPVGPWDASTITIKQLVTEVQKNSRPGASSLERAEFNAKLKKALTPKVGEVAESVVIEGDLAVDRFIGLVNFFLGVDAKDAWLVIDAIAHPEFYENFEKALADAKAGKKMEPTPVPIANTAPVAPVPAPKPASSPAPTASASVANLKDIKAVVERKFAKDANGQLADPAAALTMLNDLATRYGDDRIRELYVFNEKTGSFEWNYSLLT